MTGTVSFLLGLTGCNSGNGEGAATTDVVAAFYPLAYAAQQVGGADVRVRNLTPAGAEPHDLELTAGDAKEVDDADLVVYLGDGFMPGLQEAVANRSRASLDLLAGQHLTVGKSENGERAMDPHVWLDPIRSPTSCVRSGTRSTASRRRGRSQHASSTWTPSTGAG